MKREDRLQLVRKIDRSIRPAGMPHVNARPKKQPRQARGGVQPNIRRMVPDPIEAETINPILAGKTAVLFATGPSLTQEVVDTVLAAREHKELYLFGCNDAYQIMPFLDVLYACDASWWNIHYKELVDYPTKYGMWTQEPHLSKGRFPKLHRIAGRNGQGLSTDQNQIHFGNNSGYQLINLALLFGIKHFILCGYNMAVVGGKRHFFGDHPQGLNRSGSYTGFVRNYDSIKPELYQIDIINATPNSALRAFPQMSLDDALQKF